MLKIYFGNKSFLFPGKAETENEINAVRVCGNELKSDVLKVAKYGSIKSTSDEFLQYVNPFISVISASGIEDRNLPASEVLNRLKKHKSEIYRTDEHGAIILKSDGNYLKIK